MTFSSLLTRPSLSHRSKPRVWFCPDLTDKLSRSFISPVKVLPRSSTSERVLRRAGQLVFPASIQLIGAIHRLAEYWHFKELEVVLHKTSLELCQKLVFDKSHSAKRVVSLTSLFMTYLAMNADWNHILVFSSLGRTRECYVAELADGSKYVICLGSDGLCSSLSPPVIDHFTPTPIYNKKFSLSKKTLSQSKFCRTHIPGFFPSMTHRIFC